MADLRILGTTPKSVSRRRFVQGVIGGGATVSSANYLFRAATRATAKRSVENTV
jgi:hypothetical protein